MRLSLTPPALSLIAAIAAAPYAEAAVSIYMSPEQLAVRSSHVVEATVASVASGEHPTTGAIATYITLDVSRVLRGPIGSNGAEADATLVIREQGGGIDGRVHALDAVPVYRPGERVIAFLEPGPDRTLRTTGMFFGKYVVDEGAAKTTRRPTATRDLDGRGTIVGRPSGRLESIDVADLVAVAATAAPFEQGRIAVERPPELDRVRWARPGRAAATAKFGPLSPSDPTRWQEGANGVPFAFDVERARDPLGNGALAALQVERALAAWTEVPESRVVLVPGDTDAHFTPAHLSSPASVYPPSNIVLFGDPYDDITDPDGCAGVLAIGGYWLSTASAGSANGVAFRRALRGYVIFNDGFECFLGSTDNLAEVATHEIGHALGFGHSTAFDSIMRSSVYGARGPRLGDDDRDAAHCHYPHTFALTGPAGGESVEASSPLPITWTVTQEAGLDPGVVTLEASFDGGPWELLAADVANDGYYGWIVPERSSTDVRVRVVRPNRGGGWEAPYPSACSASSASAPFTVTVPEPSAGVVPATLQLDKASSGFLRLAWDPSCSGDVDDHAVYTGSLHQLRDGTWDTVPVTCSAGADHEHVAIPWAGDRYFLVTPLAAGVEGGLGQGSDRIPRPRSVAPCGIAETALACR